MDRLLSSKVACFHNPWNLRCDLLLSEVLLSNASTCAATSRWNTPITAEIQAKTAKKGAGKRAAEDDIEDPEVRKRLAALKDTGAGLD
jgi:hypothetical protein